MKRSHSFPSRAVFAAAAFLAAAVSPGRAQSRGDTPPAPAAKAADESGEAGFAPKSYELSRYEKIRTKSPFEFELPTAPPPEVVNPFENIVLAGYVGSGNKVTAYLANTKTNERFTVFGSGSGRKNENGFQLLEILKGKSIRSTKARVEKDGKTEELGFDTAALSNMRGGSAGGAPGAAPPGAAGIAGRAPNGQPILRPGLPGGPPAPAAQPFQAPQAFIPGQQAQPPQPQVQGAGIASTLNGAQVGGGNPQQAAINTLVQPGQAQAPVIVGQPAPGVPAAGNSGNAGEPPRRRRVVLPSPR